MAENETHETITPGDVLSEALIDSKDLLDVVIVGRYRGGIVKKGWSTMEHLTAIGLLQVALSEIVEDMNDPAGNNG